MKLRGKNILVTGAGGGIGTALVRALLEQGAEKIYAAARNTAALAQMTQLEPRLIPVQLDITEAASVEDAARQCSDVDVLINNAGVNRCAGLLSADAMAAAREEMEVNYFGTMAMCRAFAPIMTKRGNGLIANVCSIIGLVNLPVNGTYCASKAAGHSLLQGLRAELAPKGVTVVGIYPGPVDTPMTDGQEMPKANPVEVASYIVAGLVNGEEEIFPDPMSQNVHRQLVADAKQVEKQFATMIPGE